MAGPSTSETGRKPLADWQTGEPPHQLQRLPIGVLRKIEAVCVHLQNEESLDPRTLEELNQLIPDVNRLVGKYFGALRPFKDPDSKWWSGVRRDAMYKTQDKAWELKRQEAWYFHETSYFYGAPFMRWLDYNAITAEDAAKWETVGDQEGFKNNPNILLLRIYKLAKLKQDWAMVSVGGQEFEEMMLLRGPLSDVVGEDGKMADAVLLYTESGPVSDKVELIVDHGRGVHKLRPLVPPTKIEYLS